MTVTDNFFIQERLSNCIERRGAAISVESFGSTTVVTVRGEIDASNTEFVRDVLDGFTARKGRMVVDVGGVDFIGAQGLRLMIDLDLKCQQRDIVWALVPGRLLRRLLQVADAGQALPVAESIEDARSMLESVEASPRERTLTRVAPEKLRC